MLAVGITGGIGSGKSFVCEVFSKLGIPIYSADNRAKEISNESTSVIKEITALLGAEAYINKQLNRPFVASQVFSDKNKLQKLNNIIHPAVEKDYLEWQKNYSHLPYTIKEAAILFESGAYKQLNKTIVVTAPIDIRIKRVCDRDGSTEESVRERMNNQWPTEKIIPLTDFIIENDGKKLILPQIIKIDNELRNI